VPPRPKPASRLAGTSAQRASLHLPPGGSGSTGSRTGPDAGLWATAPRLRGEPRGPRRPPGADPRQRESGSEEVTAATPAQLGLSATGPAAPSVAIEGRALGLPPAGPPNTNRETTGQAIELRPLGRGRSSTSIGTSRAWRQRAQTGPARGDGERERRPEKVRRRDQGTRREDDGDCTAR
jgi:hypothetical protein